MTGLVLALVAGVLLGASLGALGGGGSILAVPVLHARGVTFGLVAVGGAALGALASARVPEDVLMAGFAVLLLVVGGVMLFRLRRGSPDGDGRRPGLDDPIDTSRLSAAFTGLVLLVAVGTAAQALPALA